jgi:hypothetical protein
MFKIIEQIRKRVNDQKFIKLDKVKVARFTLAVHLSIVAYLTIIAAFIFLIFRDIFSIGDIVGYQLAVLPLIIIVFERPFDTVVTLNNIVKFVKSNQNILNAWHTNTIFVQTQILMLMCVLLIAGLYVFIDVYFISSSVFKDLPIITQRNVFAQILVFWLLEKYAEKRLTRSISNLKADIWNSIKI